MAGAPTGRGCDACRKQKKKCDLAQPACSRCTRLRIRCVGCGKKRYMFKQAKPRAGPAATPATTSAATHTQIIVPVRVPSNHLTKRTGAFISVLNVSDLRYDISGFGAFLRELPPRLGRNRALDASVHALTVVFPALYLQEPTPAMLAAYVHALRCLRLTLADRVTAQTPETLCAIYLITLCQSWIGSPDDNPVGHSEAIVHILNCIASNGWTGHFENQLFVTLAVSILPESIYNQNIVPGPWFRRVIDNFAPYATTSQKNGGPGPALGFLTLARLVEFVRDPRGDISDIHTGHNALLLQTAQARGNLARMAQDQCHPSPSLPGGVEAERIRLLCVAQFAVLLATTMLVNSLLSVLMPSNTKLPEQVAGFPDELVVLSREVSKYKPVGSGFIPTCLMMGSIAASTPTQVDKMTDAMAEYGLDPAQAKWEQWAREMNAQFKDLRFKVALAHLENSVPEG